MKDAIRKRAGDFTAIIVLMVIALGVGFYILSQERLRFPFIQSAPFKLKAELATAQAVVAGQGQTVRVAGVRIGDIGGVSLKNGRAIVSMDIDPQYKGLIHTDATALLRPKTGLKDMFLEINPGSNSAPAAKANWTMPIRNTLPDINPDEIFSVLDTDTRYYL
jgi:phospholipid/cholesterol/gamma-HCH transport system substrate-binding protein